MHFHNILLQIQYSVTKPIEILHTIADSLQYFDFIIALNCNKKLHTF